MPEPQIGLVPNDPHPAECADSPAGAPPAAADPLAGGLRFLERSLERAGRIQTAHYDSAAILSRRHYQVGVPAIMLATLVGSSVFSALGEGEPVWGRAAVGAASILAAVLTAVQTFLRHDERAEKHRAAGVSYGSMKRRLEQYVAYPPATAREMVALLEQIRTDWDGLNRECPTIPESVWERVEKKRGSEGNASGAVAASDAAVLRLTADQLRQLGAAPAESRTTGSGD
jgi:hypothetical protein